MQTGKDTGLSRVEQITVCLHLLPERKGSLHVLLPELPEHIGGPNSPPPNSYDALGIPGRQNRLHPRNRWSSERGLLPLARA